MTSPRPAGPRRTLRHWLAGAAATSLLLGSSAWAKDPQKLRTRALAATCAQCHGTDGHAVEGEALIRLAGLPKDHLMTQLLAFRTGQRPATIMHQITRGYSQEQLDEVATYFAAQK
jgi:cytochrome c553